MTDLTTRSQSLMDTRRQRGASRELTRIRQNTEIATASYVAEIDFQQSVTEAALIATTSISVLEAHLTSLVPHAEPRLRHIADAGAMAMAQTVVKAGRS